MIEAYFRPGTLEEAIQLLDKDQISTYPLGGGNVLSQNDSGKIKVVDLQLLKLTGIHPNSTNIAIGANTTLQDLIENEHISKAIRDATMREAPINLRQTSTIAGTLVSSKGKSPLAVVMLAVGAKVVTQPDGTIMDIDKWFSTLESGKPSKLVVRFDIPNDTDIFYLDISKTPSDNPFAHSAMSIDKNQTKCWVIGLKDHQKPFIERKVADDSIIENAYSHFRLNTTEISYNKQVIDVLFHRLSDEANKG